MRPVMNTNYKPADTNAKKRLGTKPFDLYAEHPLAAEYAALVPSEYRADAIVAPREEWWTWRTHEVHVDRTLPDVTAPARELTVVLVHGGGGNGRLLAPIAIALARAGYEVVAPDLPPYGLTRMGSEPLTYDAWVAIVSDLARAEHARNGRRIVLFGLSMGGMTAYHVAARAKVEGWGSALFGIIATTMMDLRDPLVVDAVVARTFLARIGRLAMRLVPSVVDAVWRPVTDVAPVHLVANDPKLVDLVLRDPLI